MSKPEPVFNLDLTLTGWEGPFKNLKYFLIIAEKAEACSPFIGRSHVLSDGTLVKGGAFLDYILLMEKLV